MGLFEHVILGQVRQAIKSQESEAMWSLTHSLACFGQKFKRMVFKRTTSSRFAWEVKKHNCFFPCRRGSQDTFGLIIFILKVIVIKLNFIIQFLKTCGYFEIFAYNSTILLGTPNISFHFQF
jgi:hypothetical protein